VESKCRRCGKPLTNPRSRERGFGPRCWKTLGHEFAEAKDFEAIRKRHRRRKTPKTDVRQTELNLGGGGLASR